MKFTYKIDTVNKTDGFMGVVYIPFEDHLTSIFIKVPIVSGTVDDQHTVIRERAPIEWWALEKEKTSTTDDRLDALLGSTHIASSDDVFSARQKIEDELSDSDLVNITKQRLNDQLTAVTQQLTLGYPQVELDSWPIQLIEAEKILNNGDISINEIPYIYSAAQEKGITTVEFAQRVLNNSKEYRVKLQRINTGIKKTLAAIDLLYQKRESKEIGRDEFKQRLEEINISKHIDFELISL